MGKKQTATATEDRSSDKPMDPNRPIDGLNIGLLHPDEDDVEVVVERLNQLLVAFQVVIETEQFSRTTLAKINERTKLMGGGHLKSGQSITTKAKEPGFGVDPIEREAVIYLQEYVRGWRVGQPYLHLSTVTDHIAFKGYKDRKGRPFTQDQVATLVRMGGMYAADRFD